MSELTVLEMEALALHEKYRRKGLVHGDSAGLLAKLRGAQTPTLRRPAPSNVINLDERRERRSRRILPTPGAPNG